MSFLKLLLNSVVSVITFCLWEYKAVFVVDGARVDLTYLAGKFSQCGVVGLVVSLSSGRCIATLRSKLKKPGSFHASVCTFETRFVQGNPSTLSSKKQWPVPSRRPASPPVARPPASSWPPRRRARALRRRAASRSRIVTGPARSHSVRFAVTRSPPSCLSASFPSSASCARLPRTSRPISASRAPPSGHSRKPVKRTWLACLRTPTCVPSTPSA